VTRLASSGVAFSILLRNPLPGINTVIAQQFGPCPVPSPWRIDIAGGGTYALRVHPCIGDGDGSGNFVQLWTTMNAEDTLCATVNLTLAAGAGIEPTIGAALHTTLTVVSVHADVISSTLQEIITGAINFSYAINAASQLNYQFHPFQLPNVTLLRFDGIQTSLDAVAANASQIAADASSMVSNFSNVTHPFDAQLAAIQAQITDAASQDEALVKQLKQNNTQAQLKISELEAVAATIPVLSGEFVGFATGWGNSLADAIDAAFTQNINDANGWDKPIPGDDDGDNFFNVLGSMFVGLAKLTDDGVGLLADGLNAIGSVGDWISWFIHWLLGVVIVCVMFGAGVSTTTEAAAIGRLSPSAASLYHRVQGTIGDALEPLDVLLAREDLFPRAKASAA
jgi:hypothetical protein